MEKIEHLGIAVRDLEKANALYEKLLGFPPYKTEKVAEQGVLTSFFRLGETKIELLAATGPQSPIQKFLDKKGEGMHHVAFLVADLEKEIARLQNLGFAFVSTQPKLGADGKRVVFLHPKSAHGILVELCQEINPFEATNI